jgi:hypothetical protein
MSTFARRGLAVVAVVSILEGVARAAILTTAPLELTGSNSFSCLITNVGAKDISLSFAVVDGGGVTVASSNGTVTLAPLHGTGVSGVTAALHPRTCQFLVQGGKRSVRASACVLDSGGTCIANSEAH